MVLPRRLEAPVFFTSASKVKIPFVGDDTRAVKLTDTRFYPISNPLEKHHNEVSRHFVRLVSNDVKFDDGVVRERCSHALPFKSHDFSKLFRADFVKSGQPTKGREYSGRFDAVGYNRKPPSHLKKLHYLDVFKEKTVVERRQEDDVSVKSGKKLPAEASVFSRKDQAYLSSGITVKEWDQVMLEKLSKDTAHWIVYEGATSGSQKEKLGNFLKGKYGEKLSNTHIVRAEVSETDLQKLKKSKEEELKRMKDMEKLKELEKQKNDLRENKLYRKSLAEYYRLPRFLSQQRSNVITTSSEVNQTAQGIKVKHMEPSPPTKMEDFLNNVGEKYIKSTDNEFEQRLYTGQAKPVYQKVGDRSRVIMDDLSEYKLEIRPRFPPNPKGWAVSEDEKKTVAKFEYDHERYSRGLQRWTALPTPADFMSERGLNPPRSEKAQIESIEYNKLDSMVDNKPLITLVEEWRSKWKLVGQWQDIPISEILIDMESLHDHIRLGAVAACAMASLHKKPLNEIAGLAVKSQNDLLKETKEISQGHLHDDLVAKVKEKLQDKNERVRLAAAICLYSLNFRDDVIFHILKENMKKGYGCDRLASAQCLALSCDVSADVIRMIVELLLEKHDTPSSALTASQKEQATMLLVHLSGSTNLVHSLLAEQLNSSSWKDRVTACQVLAKLVGAINKDLVHKLTNLMWRDWSTEVRKAAAETLGHTGHGRDIHYELRNKLANGNEIMRVNVLKKISHLSIMTAALLPTFMTCFTDEYVSVRLQACKTAGKLKLYDENIGAELLRLMEYDPAWKIKAYAIKAIREIGFSSDKVLKALVWALRFEDEPDVRMEACLAVRNFYKDQSPDTDVLHILQDRALVEPDSVVKNEVQTTLKAFDAACYGDNMDMIRQIKTEVKRLCRKGVIAAKIAMYEKELDKFQNKAHYLGFDMDDVDDDSTLPSPLNSERGNQERTPLSSRQTPSTHINTSRQDSRIEFSTPKCENSPK